MDKKPLTIAQQIFGKDFENKVILNERPAQLRSANPDEDKLLFKKYRQILRRQCKTIKYCLR